VQRCGAQMEQRCGAQPLASNRCQWSSLQCGVISFSSLGGWSRYSNHGKCVEVEITGNSKYSTETASNGISRHLLMRPPRLGTKNADLLEILISNLPFLVDHSFLVQEQNYKLAFPQLTKRQVQAMASSSTNMPSPLLIDTPIPLLPLP